MSTHAPSPWTIGTGRDQGYILDADGERVCRLTNDPTARANGALIAASTDLLKALRGMMAAFVPQGLPGQKEACLAADDAVARATEKNGKELQA